jgi:hypothetical protein
MSVIGIYQQLSTNRAKKPSPDHLIRQPRIQLSTSRCEGTLSHRVGF